MTWGQRLAIRVLAFALRRGADVLQLRAALYRAFPRRTDAEREAMWNAALNRANRPASRGT